MVNQPPIPNEPLRSEHVDFRKTSVEPGMIAPEAQEIQIPSTAEVPAISTVPDAAEVPTPLNQGASAFTQEQVNDSTDPPAPTEPQVTQPSVSTPDQVGTTTTPAAPSVEQSAKMIEDAFAQRVEANASKEPTQIEPAE